MFGLRPFTGSRRPHKNDFHSHYIILLSDRRPPAEDAVYEYAFVRALPDYAIYYVFDLDTMTVRQFKTNDAGALVGTFTGDVVYGADIRYSRDWHEIFSPVSPGDLSRVLITDYSGFTFEYVLTDPGAAQVFLKNGGDYDIRLE